MSLSLYQVSFQEEDVAKFKKSSKTKVTWVFRVGVNGGTEREHAVSLTWSKQTGKQEIEMDGSEQVWFGRRRGASVFDYQWESTTSITTKPLKLRILATSAPKLHATFRCYDLIINGQIFAQLPVYASAGRGYPVDSSTDPAVDGSPGSIVDVIYPNGLDDTNEEHLQPEQQPVELRSCETALVVAEQPITTPQFEPEPVDLLS